MSDVGSFLLLSVAVFSGSFGSGLAGFAFSAVAGGILLHVLRPIEAVPLMMACSVGVQATNLWALRKNIQWKDSLILVLGACSAFLLPSGYCTTPIHEPSGKVSDCWLPSTPDICSAGRA